MIEVQDIFIERHAPGTTGYAAGVIVIHHSPGRAPAALSWLLQGEVETHAQDASFHLFQAEGHTVNDILNSLMPHIEQVIKGFICDTIGIVAQEDL